MKVKRAWYSCIVERNQRELFSVGSAYLVLKASPPPSISKPKKAQAIVFFFHFALTLIPKASYHANIYLTKDFKRDTLAIRDNRLNLQVTNLGII